MHIHLILCRSTSFFSISLPQKLGFTHSSTIQPTHLFDWNNGHVLITKPLPHPPYPFPYYPIFVIHIPMLSPCYFSPLPFTCFKNVSIIALPLVMDRPLLIHTSPQPIFPRVFLIHLPTLLLSSPRAKSPNSTALVWRFPSTSSTFRFQTIYVTNTNNDRRYFDHFVGNQDNKIVNLEQWSHPCALSLPPFILVSHFNLNLLSCFTTLT